MLVLEIINALHAGGAWGYIWRLRDRRSWYYRPGDTTALRGILREAGTHDVFYGVHPVRAPRPPHERGRIADVCAINCLFTEFDCKDFGGTKEGIEAHLQARAMCWPTVVVDSGGGLHCYWLLERPHVIADDAGRQRIADLQARFVRAIGGDAGARDLARVLRVPGTVNAKYDPPRMVEIVEVWRANAIYTLDEMCEFVRYLEARFAPPAPQPVPHAQPTSAESIIERFNRHHRPDPRRKVGGIGGILVAFARQPEGNRNNMLFWSANRLRERTIPLAHAEALLLPIAQAIGLPDGEAIRTIRSAYRGGGR